MDVVQVLSRIIAENAPKQGVQRAEAPTQPEKPVPPTPPAVFQRSSPSPTIGYTAKGTILRLGQFEAATKMMQMEKTSDASFLAQTGLQQTPVSVLADSFGTHLLQHFAAFVKQNLQRTEDENREQKKHTLEFSSDAEEQALEILEEILELAGDFPDRDGFCTWLDERISGMENELKNRFDPIPEPQQRMLHILAQASQALRHGLEPEYILERLSAEIERKKKI